MGTRHRTHLIATIVLLTSSCSILVRPEAKELGIKIERNVPVPMRDGTILRANIHRPDRGGPYPVLVQRTPYGKGGNFSRFVKAGYIVVSQDARGRYESEGKFEMGPSRTYEAEDGYDTIEWAAKISGSNGKVGTFGISLPALLQWRLAPLRPNSLLAMSAWSIPAGRSIGTGSAVRFPGFRLQWWDMMATDKRRKANLPGVHTGWERFKLWSMGDSEKWINWLPWNELPNDFFGYPADAAYSFTARRKDSGPLNLHKGCKNISVPNLDVVGWYDHANGDMLLFRTMIKEARTEVARKGSKIIIGPWDHMSLGGRGSGNIDFGPDAAFDIRGELRIRWFDYWLKGKQNGVDKEAPVKIFVMGDNKWRDEQHWPLQRTKEKILFIVSNGQANTPSGNGKLADEKPQSSGTDNYLYDPRDPVPTPYEGRPKAADWRPLDTRQDILVYQTESLSERIEVTGNPVVELYAASSVPDTDWFVRLIDVAPDGLARDVSSAMIRARYRDGSDKPKLIKPHEVVKYTIRMRPTSNAFLPGHRIRLDITSSDFPVTDRNHNTAADQNADATLVTARQTIYHGGEQATRIILPWVPNPTEEERPSKEEPEPEPERQMYPLHQAAADGDIEKVKLLLSQGADVNAEDGVKEAPLHHAARTGKLEVVQLLVEAGAEVNAMGTDWPPLCIAAANVHIPVMEYLIAHGADTNAGQGNWSALHHVAGSGRRGRRDVAELLLQNGADVNDKDELGRSPLYLALRRKNLDIAELLIDSGADLKSKSGGLTPLHKAAVEGVSSFVELLLSKGAKVDERDDNYEFTALHYAARFGCKDVAKVLIAKGANIKAKDKWDYQPIHWAAYHDRADVAELLISKGADINAKTSLGQTPLQLAQERKNTKTVELLLKHGAEAGIPRNTPYAVSDKPYVVLERGDIKAVIVNNEPVDDKVLPGHRAGYSGVASLTHRSQRKNLFVPLYAGLNFEHIHDGTVMPRDILFEPRRAPMKTRQVNQYTVELYQPPTPHWQLESWLRYQLLEDGAIQMTLECIPHARTFENDYIGLFFASYIDQPESLDIYFLGCPSDEVEARPRWIRGVTPAHGELSTHLAFDDNRNFAHDPDFPLTLVFNRSKYCYSEPWYWGVSHGVALVFMFCPSDHVRFSQSPSGGGKGNPAWDFQWFIPQYKVGQRYRFVMRAMYLPFVSREQLIQATASHRTALLKR